MHPCLPGGIRTHNLNRRAAADLRLKPRERCDRLRHFNKNHTSIYLVLQSGLLPTVFPTVNLYAFHSLTLEQCAPPISCPSFNYLHNTLQQLPLHIMRYQSNMWNVEYFNRLGSRTKNDARYAYEIQSCGVPGGGGCLGVQTRNSEGRQHPKMFGKKAVKL